MDEHEDNVGELSLDQQIKEWRTLISDGPLVRVEVLRVERGRKPMLVGVLNSLPDEEDLRSEFGGGRFTLRVKAPDRRGRLVYKCCVSVNLAGQPRDPPSVVAARALETTHLHELVEAAVADALAPVLRRLHVVEAALRGRATVGKQS